MVMVLGDERGCVIFGIAINYNGESDKMITTLQLDQSIPWIKRKS